MRTFFSVFSVFSFTVFLIFSLISESNGAVNATTRQIVQDALLQALSESTAISEQSVSDGSIISSQIANDASKQLQYTGDVLEAATQILVAEYGIGILDDANEVLAEMSATTSDSVAADK